jgi:hypothetical protein
MIIGSKNALRYHPHGVVSTTLRHYPPLQPPLGKRSCRRYTIEETPTDVYKRSTPSQHLQEVLLSHQGLNYWVIQNDCDQVWQLCTKIYVATVWRR